MFGDGFVLLGNVGEFLDSVFSSGVTIALKSAAWLRPWLIDNCRAICPAGNWSASKSCGAVLMRFMFMLPLGTAGVFSVFYSIGGVVNVKTMICSILAGYVWDKENAMTRRAANRLIAIADLCPSL
jgi:hypothetical protein